MKVTLLGMGCGSEDTMTQEAVKALEQADIFIGAERLLESVPKRYRAARFAAIDASEICRIIEEQRQKAAPLHICVLYSGDTGFYSGTRRLLPLLKAQGYEGEFDILPGISSMQLFSARLGKPWQDWNLFSAHGIHCNAVSSIMAGKPAFFLTGGRLGPADLCRQLMEAGLGDVKVWIGENLSYETENIYHGSAAEAAELIFQPLSVMLAEPSEKPVLRTPGMADDDFIRGDVPMTKQEVRAAVLGKLGVREDHILWDVGAGTGSVSVELALAARKGWVHAIECNEAGCRLIEENRRKFGAWNLSIIEGTAPDALKDLPVPDAVFIGGTKGRVKEITTTIHEKNPQARICITAIALETLHEAVEALMDCGFEAHVTQIAVSRTKKTGKLNLLMANNPVFLITNAG